MTVSSAPPTGNPELDRSFAVAVDHLLNNVTEAFAIIDDEGRVLRANIAFRRLTGPAGGASDASFLQYVSPDHRQMARDALQSLNAGTPQKTLSLDLKIGRDKHLFEVVLNWIGSDRLYALTGRDVTDLKERERERLDASATNFAIERTGGIGHWRASVSGHVELSMGASQVLGLDPKSPAPSLNELLGMVHSKDRERVRQAAQKSIDQRKPFVGNLAFQRPDGDVRKLCLSGAASLGAQGQLTALHGVVVDRTNEVAALSEALNSPTMVSRFVEASPFPMFVCDADMNVVMGTPGYFEAHGTSLKDALGSSLYDVMPWMPDRWRQVHQRVLSGETVRNEAEYVTRDDGSAFWVRWVCTPWRNARGAICGLVLMRDDITESIRSRHEVESSKERMHLGMSLASIMIWELDFERREIALEGEWRNLFPERPTFDTFTGRVDWIHEADREMLTSRWKAHMAGGPPYTAQYRVRMSDDRELWHNSHFQITKSANGTPVRAIAVIVDVTERKRAEFRALEAEQKAIAAGSVKSEFLANISHEVRTPLNGVLAVSELLARTKLDEKQAEMVKLVTTSGETLLRVMDDLVEFSRLESEQVVFEVRPFELEDTIRNACEAARIQAEAKGLEFESFISANIDGVFRGDPVRINQVLSNLLSNAVKFTDRGRISVNASVSDRDNKTVFHLSIEDTGIGFAPEVVDRLFERFEQADGSTSRKFGGLGLGLSMVKRLVEGMNGQVSASSEEGKGSTFEINLPIARDRISALGKFNTVAVEDVDAETTLEGINALIAEDNPMNRRVVELLMAQSGMAITFAENGKEAVEKFQGGGFDIVLMDLQMPVMGGLQATREIRSWESAQGRPPTPIVALSANATDDHVQEAKQAGANDHVAKPIVREILFEAIARYASGRSAAVQPSDDADFDLDALDEIDLDLDIAV